MTIWEFEGKKPTVEKGTFVFPTADIIGNVTIGSNCYIGPGSVLRGDYGKIMIGSGCSIQENVIIHARLGEDFFWIFLEGRPDLLSFSFPGGRILLF